MFRSYFKTAWRNIVNDKVYTALNILGLAIGMAVALLIGLWVYSEHSYDKFLPGYEELYQVKMNADNNGEITTYSSTSLALADALRMNIPEIKYVAETDWMGPHGLMAGNRKFYMNGGQVGADFLKMFRYPLLQGNAATVLQQPYSIVLTASTAAALFGNEDPLDKIVRVDNTYDLKVTGVLEDLPANSTFQFKYLIPFSFFEQTTDWVKAARRGGWKENSFQVFAQLQEKASYEKVAVKMKNIAKNNDPSVNTEIIMQPMKNWHLYSDYKNGKEAGGFIDYIRMFGIIGILVLLIACINFINLSTARSGKRAKEVGIRKALGSRKSHLVMQFLIESVLITFFAFIISIVLVQLALPGFAVLTGRRISIPFLSGTFWCLMMAYVLITGFIAGCRPAFYLSSFRPVKVLKGNLRTGKGGTIPRKVLIVLQFSCSVALIISTIIVYQQMQHAKNRPIGYNISRLMMTNDNEDLSHNYVALKDELLQSGVVESVTKASSPATNIYSHSKIDYWPGKRADETFGSMGTIAIATDYFKTLGMQLKEGRDFLGSVDADSLSVILNEAAVKRLRLKEPLDQSLTWHDTVKLRITGVVKDALMESPFASVEPTMFIYNPAQSAGNTIMYRLTPDADPELVVEKLKQIFNKYSPGYPYNYRFVSEVYAGKFNLELFLGKLAGLFASLSILISCLGLVGLAAYVAEQRTKEIGVRKVLGASVLQLWMLLLKDFMVLVAISCLIASPLAWFFLQNWLQKYAYRINIGIGAFLAAAFIAIFITTVTTSYQAVRTAVANPLKSLRSE